MIEEYLMQGAEHGPKGRRIYFCTASYLELQVKTAHVNISQWVKPFKATDLNNK